MVRSECNIHTCMCVCKVWSMVFTVRGCAVCCRYCICIPEDNFLNFHYLNILKKKKGGREESREGGRERRRSTTVSGKPAYKTTPDIMFSIFVLLGLHCCDKTWPNNVSRKGFISIYHPQVNASLRSSRAGTQGRN